MRKLFFLLVCFAISFYNATSQHHIEGLGVFKLGITDTSIITKLAKEKQISILVCDRKADTRNNNSILKLVYNKQIGLSPIDASYDPQIQIYQINQYKFLDKYEVERLKLIFYKAKLYSIEFTKQPFELDNEFKARYGKPLVREINNYCNCYIDDKQVTLPEKGFVQTWYGDNIDNNNVIGIYQGESYYDNGCRKYNMHFGYVRNIKMFSQIHKLNEEAKNKLIQQKSN